GVLAQAAYHAFSVWSAQPAGDREAWRAVLAAVVGALPPAVAVSLFTCGPSSAAKANTRPNSLPNRLRRSNQRTGLISPRPMWSTALRGRRRYRLVRQRGRRWLPRHWPASGLPHIRLHDLRHGCVSVLLAMGVPPRTAMGIVGH